MQENTYDTDFYAWATAQAELLRTGQLHQADIEHIAEEIESIGKSELRELENRLAVLFVQFQMAFPTDPSKPELGAHDLRNNGVDCAAI